MATDPNLMAALLQGSGEPSADDWEDFARRLGQTTVGRYASGVGQGLQQQYIDPLKNAPSILDPGQIGQQLQQAPAAIGQAATNVAQMAMHPQQTASAAAQAIREKLSTPEGAGELTSYLLPGPGEIASGARRAGEGLGIWGGYTSAKYDPDMADLAKRMKAAGKTDREIYDATADASGGGGYWNPPDQWGQRNPWVWIPTQEAKMAPGAMEELKAEGQRQFEGRMAAYEKAGSRVSGAPLSGGIPPDVMKRAGAELTQARTPADIMGRPYAEAFMQDAYPKTGAMTQYRLEDFLEHPELYEHYPGLREYPVHVEPWAPGSYTTGKKQQISIGDLYGGLPFGMSRSQNALDTLLHEPSHVIQDVTGMPGGGSAAQIDLLRQHLTRGLDPSALQPNSLGQLSSAEQRLLANRADQLYWMMEVPPYGGFPRSSPAGRGYANLAGEANARLPYTVHQQEWMRSRLGGDQVYPFEQYGKTGVLQPPQDLLVTNPQRLLYHPYGTPATEAYGVSGSMGPRAPTWNQRVIGRNVAGGGQLEGPVAPPRPEQLALGLRRAPRR